MQQLTIIDLSADLSDKETYLFKTEAGARGYAARKGNFYGTRLFSLNGKQIHPVAEDMEHAEEPCGDIITTRSGQVARTWKAA